MENTAEEFDPQLIDSVRKQIEYYFSKENLQNDPFLTSQMDASMSVPISVVMKFAKLKALTQDEAVVRRALVDSSVSIVDNRIKANIKASGRSTIILREIPSEAPEEEVKEIFNYVGCKRILSVRSDIGDTWFVTMESEEDAKDTALDLRLKKRTFRGQPVKARIKTEAVVRSFFPVNAPVPPVAPVYPPLHLPFPPVVPNQIIDLSSYGYLPVPPTVDTPTAANPPEAGAAITDKPETSETSLNSGENPVAVEVKETATVAEETDKPAAEEDETEGAKNSSSRARKVTKPTRETSDRPRRGEREPRKVGTPSYASKETKERKTDVPAVTAPTTSKPPIEVNTLNFPPLQTLEDTPVPTPGYKETYQKYSFETIISIVKNVKEANLPADLTSADHPLAMTATPNMDLLKRQRTFSIDETREQLRQGRPVQREAIISGAVDYRSLMFGDDHDHHKAPPSQSVTRDHPSSSSSSSNNQQVNPPAPSGVEGELAKAIEESCSIKDASSEKESEKKAPVVSSPQRISASTWAAMVKSSAQATETATRSQSNSKVSPIDPTRGGAKKAAASASTAKESTTSNEVKATPTRPGKESDEKDKEKDRKSHRSERRKHRGEGENKPPVTSENQEPSKSADETSSKTTTESSTNATASEASVGVWGKASFANVLKQAIPEDAITSEEPTKKAVAPSQTQPSTSSSGSSAQKPLKLNSRGSALKDSNSNHHHEYSRGHHSRGGDRAERGGRNRDKERGAGGSDKQQPHHPPINKRPSEEKNKETAPSHHQTEGTAAVEEK